MQLKVKVIPKNLKFKFDAGTSRGILRERNIWYIKVFNPNSPNISGIGEAAPLKGLSIDDRDDFEEHLLHFCEQLESFDFSLDENDILNQVQTLVSEEFPAIRFAFESALLDLFHGGKRMIFDNDFYHSKLAIPTNGLIWMGDKDFMLRQIREKLNTGFSCIKIKIGAIDFDQECSLLAYIREQFSEDQITLRVDANGAFHPDEALYKLKKLSKFQIHSIEQPIKPRQWKVLHKLCKESPIPIALDEELIGIHSLVDKQNLLEEIQPQYIILKPSLIGGVKACQEWIALAHKNNIEWWITSALESNIGLNVISQFVSNYRPKTPQGLGTGSLFHNNISSPLTLQGEWMSYDSQKTWSSISI